MLNSLKLLAGLVCVGAGAAQACLPGEANCTCDASGAMITSEPAFVTTGLQASPPPPSLSPTVVHVFNFDFSTNPSGNPIVDAMINAGEAIRWQWDDGFHSVTSVAGSSEVFDSGAGFALPPMDHTFNTPGVYSYYCAIHGFDNGNGTAGGMSGTITVLAVPEPATLSIAAPAILMLRRRRR